MWFYKEDVIKPKVPKSNINVDYKSNEIKQMTPGFRNASYEAVVGVKKTEGPG